MAEFKRVFGAPEFRPRAVVDTASRARKQADRNIEMMKDAMAWNRQLDRWAEQDARSKTNALQDLAPLIKSGAELYKDITLQSEKDKKTGEIYAGLIGDLESSPAEQALDEDGRLEAENRAQVAADVENKEGDPALAQVIRRQQSSNARGYKAQQVDILSAQTDYRPWVFNYLETSGEKLRGTDMTLREAANSADPVLVSRAIAQAQNQFFQKYKDGALLYATKDSIVKGLKGVIPQVNGTLSASYLADGLKAQRDQAKTEQANAAYNVGMTATPGQLQDRFGRLSENAWLSNGFKTRAEANEATVKSLVAGLKDRGDVEGLRVLLGVQKIPGQKGTELASNYGHIIYPAIREAASNDRANDRIAQEDLEDRMYVQLRNAGSLQEKRQIIESTAVAMEAKGLDKEARELRENAEELEVAGNSEVQAAQLKEQIRSGAITDAGVITQARLRGDITEEQATELKQDLSGTVDFSAPKDAAAKGPAADWGKKGSRDVLTALGLQTDKTGTITALKGAGMSVGNAALLTGQIKRDANAIANKVVRENPNLSGVALTTKVQEALTIWYNENFKVSQGKYYISDSLINTRPGDTSRKVKALRKSTGDRLVRDTISEPATFATPNRATGKQQTFSWNPGLKDEKGKVIGLSPADSALFNPLRGDILFDSSDVEEFVETYNTTGNFDPELVEAAAALPQIGSPRALLQQQISAHKLDVRMQPKTYRTARGSLISATEGAQMLMTLGVPAKGAAWLSGNIMQESSWNGQRTWGEVDGDGSDENGGLVSWMNDAERNHFRLTNIEKMLGKPIEQASNEEQLAIMLVEMRKRNPDAYKVFMNPYATDRQLMRASKQYWGYRDEGRRFSYAQQIETQL